MMPGPTTSLFTGPGSGGVSCSLQPARATSAVAASARPTAERERRRAWTPSAAIEQGAEGRAEPHAKERDADDQVGEVVAEARAEEPRLRDLEDHRRGRDKEDQEIGSARARGVAPLHRPDAI